MNHVLHGLAVNPSLPPELIDRLITIADPDLSSEFAARTDLTPTQLTTLAARGDEIAVQLAYGGRLTADHVDPAVQPYAALALLDEGAGRLEWTPFLATHPTTRVREKLAACPDLPPDVVRTLAADPDIQVVAELALWTTSDTAARLARHPHAEVRRAVATNESTPRAVLEMLISGKGLPSAQRCLVCDHEETPFVHESSCQRPECDLLAGASCDGSHESTVHEIQRMALLNPATPIDAAVRFADHSSMLLRSALAMRPDLPPSVGAHLAMDPVPGVRADLAENPAIDDALIRRLAADRGHDVRRRLAHNPNVPLDVLTELARATRIGSTLLPRIAAASPQETAQLAGSRDPAVRMLVAQRRDLSAAIRDALAADPDAKVAKSVAPHPGLSDALLRVMVARHGVQVVARVAANPGASPTLLAEATRHQPPVRKVFREVARHPCAPASALLACLTDRQARPLAAAHPNLPPAVIAELLTDNDDRVAEAAASNPSLAPTVMSVASLGFVP
ncbi:hypothetical protein ACWHLZ_01795 [Streptomyces chartreusis]|uniref:hypothetical protein n=1 Tax=Streptomyces chartreusis TaxID=1969 RepID=UPI0033F68B08